MNVELVLVSNGNYNNGVANPRLCQLSAVGREQALKLKRNLSSTPFDKVIHSNFEHSRLAARLIAGLPEKDERDAPPASISIPHLFYKKDSANLRNRDERGEAIEAAFHLHSYASINPNYTPVLPQLREVAVDAVSEIFPHLQGEGGGLRRVLAVGHGLLLPLIYREFTWKDEVLSEKPLGECQGYVLRFKQGSEFFELTGRV